MILYSLKLKKQKYLKAKNRIIKCNKQNKTRIEKAKLGKLNQVKDN